MPELHSTWTRILPMLLTQTKQRSMLFTRTKQRPMSLLPEILEVYPHLRMSSVDTRLETDSRLIIIRHFKNICVCRYYCMFTFSFVELSLLRREECGVLCNYFLVRSARYHCLKAIVASPKRHFSICNLH